jgi:hypothetical protein
MTVLMHNQVMLQALTQAVAAAEQAVNGGAVIIFAQPVEPDLRVLST